jgi:hypothetical protein
VFTKAALATAIMTVWSPVDAGEHRSYTVTVMEQIRHEITVEATEEYAARSDALLEALRTSGSGKPWWEPSLPSVLAHARRADGFAVINIKPLHATPGPYPGQTRLEMVPAP